jgi:hypothetical protein
VVGTEDTTKNNKAQSKSLLPRSSLNNTNRPPGR